jgi:hypothetical protein
VTLPVWSNTTPLSLGNIQAEFGGTGNISLSEYYAGGLYVTAGTTGDYQGVTTPIPSSGNISIGYFYGASASGGGGGGTTTTTTAGPGTTTTTSTTTTTTTAAVPLELIFQTTGTSRFTPGSLLKTNLSNGALDLSLWGGGSGPYWVADQSLSYNGVYRTSILSPGAGFEGPATYSDPPGMFFDGVNHYFQENQSTRITAAPYPGGAKWVKNAFVLADTDPETGGATNGYSVYNWGHAAGGDTAWAVDQRFTTTNNVNCRIAGTPYVFLGVHYGNNTTQIAVGTKLGEVGLNTDLAIKIRLYDPVNNSLLATHNTWIPRPNAPGFGFASSGGTVNADTANVCWEFLSPGSPSNWIRTNFVDVGDPGNNTGAGNWGMFNNRVTAGLPTKLVITLGH